MNQPTTVVLPVHNQERNLPKLVWGILDLADSMRRSIRIIVLDDGSTDDTFDVACELAKSAPQVRALRQPSQQGLPATLRRVRRDADVAEAIVHDGSSPIDLSELAALLSETSDNRRRLSNDFETADQRGRGSRRFAGLTALNARLQQAHGVVASFRWMEIGNQPWPRRGRNARRPLSPPIAPTSSCVQLAQTSLSHMH